MHYKLISSGRHGQRGEAARSTDGHCRRGLAVGPAADGGHRRAADGVAGAGAGERSRQHREPGDAARTGAEVDRSPAWQLAGHSDFNVRQWLITVFSRFHPLPRVISSAINDCLADFKPLRRV